MPKVMLTSSGFDRWEGEFTIEDARTYFDQPSKIELNDTGCWIWKGSIDTRGYGRYGPTVVHQVFWRLVNGLMDLGKECCHTCVNRSCVNPAHIYAGTHKQNMTDAVKAGVMGAPRKLTDDQVAEIFELLALGYTKISIARAMGISAPLMTKITKGNTKYAIPFTTPK
jgi:hypothetical protein